MKRAISYAIILFVIGFEVFDANQAFGQSNSIKKVHTTIDRLIIPDFVPAIPLVKIDNPADFEKFGYGKWHYGPGLPVQKRFDLMPAGYTLTQESGGKQLLRFFTISDIHITDKESPAQAIYFAPWAKQNAISVYSPLMLYTTHVLDAAIRTINLLNKENKFDLGLSLGDAANSTQYNEVRWFIDVIDGKEITPCSAVNDGTGKEKKFLYQAKYKAEGLYKSIPWYSVIGNHDHFWMGSKPVNDKIRSTLTGSKILQTGNIFTDPDALNKNDFSLGTLDGNTEYGTITGMGVVSKMKEIPEIAPDPDRRSLSIQEWISEFSNTTTEPKGHGFEYTDNIFGGCYTFEPKAGIPLKVIVLDNTQSDDEPPAKEGIYGHGSLSNGRYDWLMAQLKAGQDEGKLMIIAAHIPIGVEMNSPMDWIPAPGFKSEADLISQLQSYSNLILWVSGHRHLNKVTPFPSKDATHPENGFWEVETKSLREFPQQLRTFDILLNKDNTISIVTVNVDPEVREGETAAISRSYAIASNQIYGLYEAPEPTGSVSYNAELVKKLSPEMEKKLAQMIRDFREP